jgi:thiosulfate reductase cytochrome b subunit
MTTGQHFWDDVYAWSLALGFILAVILIAFIWYSVEQKKFRNPFAPFIRAFEKRQAHRHQMEMIKLKAQLARTGIDPKYIDVLEEETRQ